MGPALLERPFRLFTISRPHTVLYSRNFKGFKSGKSVSASSRARLVDKKFCRSSIWQKEASICPFFSFSLNLGLCRFWSCFSVINLTSVVVKLLNIFA